MVRGKKRINPSSRPQIDVVKSYIISSNGRFFDGSGYVFKKALSEVRRSGVAVKYYRNNCMYKLEI